MSEELIQKLLEGDKRAIAKAISLVENEPNNAKQLIKEIYPYTGNSYVIGITGAPGTGKSTLIAKLIPEFLKEKKRVGVLLIDPSSPFSGGAIFGNRIRMSDLTNDENVYIRSMATRGMLGGVSRATSDAIKIFDASGKEIIIIETVGTGQVDVDVFNKVHTNVVITVPGLGDYVQTLKAGILEIADIFVVNKADRENADRTVSDLEEMLSIGPKKEWKVPIIKTIATEGKGIDKLYYEIKRHQNYLMTSNLMQEKQKKICYSDLIDIIEQGIRNKVQDKVKSKKFDEILGRIISKEIDPYSASEEILNNGKREIR
ncbi:MAG: methylmalonyl Co-A mutase-associated GTPase MeaB [Candidatus Parvarchaeota archaeon]|nr:methylmalonyl Co-A mutase-associated GTPase MeaB [Candidatus Jingweiarchaeum tengchongense]MCW1298061.1 methylmalonyl Co-A mutase-associated GTPase MeaB [Candidatus Jingweiarchaeum tengchongense]MCW1300139.1 methylmalonyl Co-A mutase-associated GTPase MeaB [Candidatus Jingweiarchaeum tengchongense]MCW1310069.1 methylmalonyl Co-A mutase-associated GTPase MeaB [Candidatus Jingweiarchaeum tengchongense]MCW1310901.1 methylmalonyl Co-A mutase-associated GTPase MeaB [Candidatus Jingweiarchaeum ten